MVLPVLILGIISRNATVLGVNESNVAPAQWASQVLFHRVNHSIIQKSLWKAIFETSHSRWSIPAGNCMVPLLPRGCFLGWIVYPPRRYLKGQQSACGWMSMPAPSVSQGFLFWFDPSLSTSSACRSWKWRLTIHTLMIISNVHLLERAIFSSTSVQTGVVKAILAKSAFTAITRPPVEREPMLTIKTWHESDARKTAVLMSVHLILCQLLHLGTFLVTLSSHSQETP